MRIIYVTSSFPFGPGEAFIMPELTELEAQGHQLKVVPLLPRGKIVQSNAERFLSDSSAAPLFSFHIIVDFITSVVQRPNVVLNLARRFSRGTVSIIAKNFAVIPKSTWLARMAEDWRADHIHAFWASGPASLAFAASHLSGIPWSFSAHRFDIIENNLMQQKADAARFVRFISADGLRLSGLEETRLGSKAVVLHLGVDVNVAPVEVTATSVPIVLCAAALVPRKGHDILLQAMQELKNRGVMIELWLAGDGELREQLERDVRTRGVEERVKFLGSISHSELIGLYANGLVTMAALASYHEGIPVSLMEAMAFALPVVATQTGGIPELLSHGAGLIVAPHDWYAVSNALHLLSDNVDLRKSLGIAARERVRSSFAASTIAAQMAALLAGNQQPQDIHAA